MEQAAADARYDGLHKELPYHDGTFKRWAKERSPQFPYHFRDGVRIWVSDEDLSPHDHFLGGAKDCPVCNPPTRTGAPSSEE
jgi:hypothetical protein